MNEGDQVQKVYGAGPAAAPERSPKKVRSGGPPLAVDLENLRGLLADQVAVIKEHLTETRGWGISSPQKPASRISPIGCASGAKVCIQGLRACQSLLQGCRQHSQPKHLESLPSRSRGAVGAAGTQQLLQGVGPYCFVVFPVRSRGHSSDSSLHYDGARARCLIP